MSGENRKAPDWATTFWKRSGISHANWDVLTFDVGEQREMKVPLLDPLKGTKEHVQDLLDRSPDAKILLDNLSGV